MRSPLSLYQRQRPLTDDELAAVPWLPHLKPDERAYATRHLRVSEALAGELICRMGHPVTYWVGVIDGLVKMNIDTADGHTITLLGLTAGGWFGEGTAIKREVYRYNAQTLRKSRVAGLPVDTFHWLLDHSIGFNRFVMNQLNQRLGQFVSALEAGRLRPEQRVARSLSELINPALCPGAGSVLNITQQELAYLVGLSRQRVNEALTVLSQRQLVQVIYGGLRVLDPQGLREFY